MSRYVVTGCAGFIGSHLAEALLRGGHEIIGVDAFTGYYARRLKESNVVHAREWRAFRLVEADLATDPLEPLMSEVDGVFHVAAEPGIGTSWGPPFHLYARNNLVATQRVFEACTAAGVRVVFASSSSIYGNAEGYPTAEEVVPRPISPYGVTKLACEQLARAYAGSFTLDVVTLRYFTVYGPRQRPDMAFARMIAALRDGVPFPVFGSGRKSRDFTYVGDVVDATIRALERGRSGAVYNVGGGTEASLNDVVRLLERLSGRKLHTRFEQDRAGDVQRTRADTTRIRAELAWVARTSLETGLFEQLRSVSEESREPLAAV